MNRLLNSHKRVMPITVTLSKNLEEPAIYCSQQERDGLQVLLWTGCWSTPMTVCVRLHQKWQGVTNSPSFSSKASSGVEPVYMDLVLRCLQ